jgi:hypothetical protein
MASIGVGAATLLATIAFARVCVADTPGVSGLGLDNSFRDLARAQSAAGRSRADAISYATLGLGLAEPAFFDAYKLVVLNDQRGGLAALAIDITALAVGWSVNHFALKPAFGSIGFDNVRPMAGECLANPGYDSYCTTSDLRQGNPSDHAALTAMGLGLTLGKIATDPQFPRNSWVVAGSVAFGTVATLMTDYLRVAADKHWLSETIMGDAVGLAFGFGVPVLGNALGIGYGKWEQLKVQAVPSTTGVRLSASSTF